MRNSVKALFPLLCCLLITCCLVSCDKKEKVGTLKITQTEFVLEKDDKKVTISLNVKGKIKNTGPYDVKNIEVSGWCEKCTEVMVCGKWFVTQSERTDDQKAVIPYLPAGQEASFSFKGIAYFFKSSPTQTPDAYPEGLEVKVLSFETVQD